MTFQKAQDTTDAKKAEGFRVRKTRDPGGEGEQRGHDDTHVQEIRAVGEKGSEAVVAVCEEVDEQLAREDHRQRHFCPVKYLGQSRGPVSHTRVLRLEYVAQKARADKGCSQALERCRVEPAPNLCSYQRQFAAAEFLDHLLAVVLLHGMPCVSMQQVQPILRIGAFQHVDVQSATVVAILLGLNVQDYGLLVGVNLGDFPLETRK